MTPAELAIIERALTGQYISDDEAEQASEALGKLRQRDWAVRVLDAWALANPGRNPFRTVRDGWATMYSSLGGSGPTPDAARLAAAQAVLPTLPEAVRAELGECP